MEHASATVHRLGPVLDWIYMRRWLVLLAVVAAVALGLRLEGLDWDNGRFYHPDERSIYLRDRKSVV